MSNSFIQHIADCLTHQLPHQARHAKIQVYPGKRSVRLYYPEFESSYYEVCIKPGNDAGLLRENGCVVEIAFHFSGSKVKCTSRLALFETHLASLQPNLGHPLVVADDARVVIRLTHSSLTEAEAEQNARLMANFLDLTYPMLRSIFETIPAGSKAAPSTPILNPNHHHAYAILSRHLDRIHAFLQGRANRPSDDVLCDWVHLCYTVELYEEGANLFNLINSSAIQPWLYERARRQAKVCRLRVNR